MANYFNLPLLLPFKFVKNGNTGMHFDDQFAKDQIRRFERKVEYVQKWDKADTTPLQCESTLAPNDLQLRTPWNFIVKTFEWTKVVDAVSYGIYNTVFDVSDVTKGKYYLYQKVAFGEAILWEAISEPIYVGTDIPDTKLITYKNSFNRDDVAWTAGALAMKFRCECDVQDMEPGREKVDYINQVRDSEVLDAVPFRKFQFYIGNEPGVAPWVTDLLNRIWCLDYVDVQGKLYTNPSGADMKITRVRGYPLVGGALDVLEATNKMSLQFMTDGDVVTGMVHGYNIETGFFGASTLVPVLEVIQNA